MFYCLNNLARRPGVLLYFDLLLDSHTIKQIRKMVNDNEKKVFNFAPGPAKLPQEVMQNVCYYVKNLVKNG